MSSGKILERAVTMEQLLIEFLAVKKYYEQYNYKLYLS